MDEQGLEHKIFILTAFYYLNTLAFDRERSAKQHANYREPNEVLVLQTMPPLACNSDVMFQYGLQPLNFLLMCVAWTKVAHIKQPVCPFLFSLLHKSNSKEKGLRNNRKGPKHNLFKPKTQPLPVIMQFYKSLTLPAHHPITYLFGRVSIIHSSLCLLAERNCARVPKYRHPVSPYLQIFDRSYAMPGRGKRSKNAGMAARVELVSPPNSALVSNSLSHMSDSLGFAEKICY